MPIISLTSVPPRFKGLEEVLGSLLGQTSQDTEIWLHIPKAYRRFPDWDGVLPDVAKGIRIVRTEEDYGPATKVLAAAAALKGFEDQIIYCDDDRVYSADWATKLLAEQTRRKDSCVAVVGRHIDCVARDVTPPKLANRAVIGRPPSLSYTYRRTLQKLAERRLRPTAPKPPRPLVRKAGVTELALGYGGVVVRPHFFDDRAYDIPQDANLVDDIWLSGHLALRGVPIWLPKGIAVCRRASTDKVHALREHLSNGRDRVAQNEAAVSYYQKEYGIWTNT